MYQKLLRESKFYDLLLRFDEDMAASARSSGCECGGVLHQANYRRKPRGGPEGLCPAMSVRLSFCCSVDGCRRRTTPQSLRFLGRRVFFGVVVLLVPLLREGATPQRLARLCEVFEVSARTIRRWQRWWREEFAKSQAMRLWQGLCAEPINAQKLPGSLVQVFAHLSNAKDRVIAVLKGLDGPPSGQIIRGPS